MGVFPSSDPPLASQTASINMISSSHIDKGKAIANKSTSFSPFEEMYNAIQATTDPTINDHLLVASDHYHMPYWLEPCPYLYIIFHIHFLQMNPLWKSFLHPILLLLRELHPLI